MFLPSIKAYIDEDNSIAKVEMEVFENGKVIRAINFEKGKEYIIDPIAPKVEKNVFRKVRLLDFVRDNKGEPVAKIKYLDTKGEAKVAFDFLAETD